MDEDVIRDLARQMREHLGYTGDSEQFDQDMIAIVRIAEKQCALVVEQTPLQLFALSSPQVLLRLIAAEVRNAP